MKKKTKYLDFYKECMEDGVVPGCNGLCNSPIGCDPLFSLVSPSYEDIDCDADLEYGYWGYDGSKGNQDDRDREFSPLRQNIVLLMAALNDEL
jgi:hypothetical protein